MSSERAVEIGWTPPRSPVPRPVVGASPGSSRGKLRSEYQARLNGMAVKKRRSGALKFPPHTSDHGASQTRATAKPGSAINPAGGTVDGASISPAGSRNRLGSAAGSAGMPATPPKSPAPPVPRRRIVKGGHQTSLLDYFTEEHGRPEAESGPEIPDPEADPLVRSPETTLEGSRTNEQARTERIHRASPRVVDVSASPAPPPRGVDLDTGVNVEMDVDSVDKMHNVDDVRGNGKTSMDESLDSDQSSSVRSSTDGKADVAIAALCTPKKASPHPESNDLLGGGVRTVTPSSVSAGGDNHIVYSDRFIPSRSGSILDSGSPFLAMSSPLPVSSPDVSRVSKGGVGGRLSASGMGGLFAGMGDGGIGGGRRGSSVGAAVRREAVDPGGIRGTEGVLPGGQGRGGGAAGTGTGSGAEGTVGSPQYWPYGSSATDAQREGQNMLNMLLRSELLGADSPSPALGEGMGSLGGAAAGGDASMLNAARRSPCVAAGASASPGGVGIGLGAGGASSSPNVFRFKVPRQAYEDDVTMSYSISPVSLSTKLMSKPSKAKRKIPKIPFKVLDAPQLQDDFYLNLVDWSSQNVLAVGLGPCVYLWSACTSKVTKLCDLGRDAVSSVAWTQRGTHLGVGTTSGLVQIWDSVKCKKIRTMGGHNNRVGTMSWNAHSLASGSRDRLILMRDVRTSQPYTNKLVGHKQEVCGLKWSFDDKQLASGGNDNKLFIWNAHSTSPVLRFSEHTAAVKAIAWSPHQHGILASGGGTADRCIRFWNSQTSARLSCVDTGSQVCNLMWSKNINEIVSTHGYSLNQIIVWRYPSMTKVTTLTGHTTRVLYLAMSPDGQTIVTGAGDETLRFWNAFPGPKSREGAGSTGLLFPAGVDIR